MVRPATAAVEVEALPTVRSMVKLLPAFKAVVLVAVTVAPVDQAAVVKPAVKLPLYVPSAAPVVLPSVSPEVKPPKAEATWSAVMAAVAVKVSPLSVALWPAPNAAKVMTDVSV